MAEKTLDPRKHYLSRGKIYGNGQGFEPLEKLAEARGATLQRSEAVPPAAPTQTASVSADGLLESRSGTTASTAPTATGEFNPDDPTATPLRALEVAIADLPEEDVMRAQENDDRSGAQAMYTQRLEEIRAGQGGGGTQ
jgi:hypothetical protein